MKFSESWKNSVKQTPLQPWLDEQVATAEQVFAAHGDYSRWLATLENLSHFKTDKIDFSLPEIQIGDSKQVDGKQQQEIQQQL